MNYCDLDRDRKQELLINAYAFGLACKNLAGVTGFDLELISQELHTAASTVVHSLSDEEVNRLIADIEKDRITTNNPFVVVRKKA